MTFAASKKRERHKPEPVSKGLAIGPSSAIRVWYKSRLQMIAAAMLEDYKQVLFMTMDLKDVRKYYAEDAEPSAIFKFALKKLQEKWKKVFNGFAKETAKEFVRQSNDQTNASIWHSLSTAGIHEPTTEYNKNVRNTLAAAVSYNHTLITGIGEDIHEKIYSAVMLSLTSPNPEEQGTSGIQNALRNIGDFSENRIELISRDQTSKLYASLSDERMRQNGVEEFEWLHSGAGKEPRESHEKMDGEIFKLDDPRMWEVGGPFGLKKGDLGPPGWAINCRCRKRPVIN
jgi:SPP1 gp7 family putative phage head morphogenesis protein